MIRATGRFAGMSGSLASSEEGERLSRRSSTYLEYQPANPVALFEEEERRAASLNLEVLKSHLERATGRRRTLMDRRGEISGRKTLATRRLHLLKEPTRLEHFTGAQRLIILETLNRAVHSKRASKFDEDSSDTLI